MPSKHKDVKWNGILNLVSSDFTLEIMTAKLKSLIDVFKFMFIGFQADFQMMHAICNEMHDKPFVIKVNAVTLDESRFFFAIHWLSMESASLCIS